MVAKVFSLVVRMFLGVTRCFALVVRTLDG